MNKEKITHNVENMVCDAVETVFAVFNKGKGCCVDREHIYNGQRTLHNITARFFIFRTLHDIYGYSYRDLSKLSGIGMSKVMRAVAKVREYIFNDKLFAAIKEEIDKQITQGLIL